MTYRPCDPNLEHLGTVVLCGCYIHRGYQDITKTFKNIKFPSEQGFFLHILQVTHASPAQSGDVHSL